VRKIVLTKNVKFRGKIRMLQFRSIPQLEPEFRGSTRNSAGRGKPN